MVAVDDQEARLPKFKNICVKTKRRMPPEQTWMTRKARAMTKVCLFESKQLCIESGSTTSNAVESTPERGTQRTPTSFQLEVTLHTVFVFCDRDLQMKQLSLDVAANQYVTSTHH